MNKIAIKFWSGRIRTQAPPIFQSSVVHSTTELPHPTGPAYLPIIRRALYHWATTSHRTRLSSNHPSCTLPLSYHIPQDPPIFQSLVVHSTTELPHPTGPAYLPIIRRALYHWATTSHRTRLSSNHPSCTLPLSYHIPQDPPIFQSLVVHSTTELPHPTGPAYLPIIRRALYHWATTSHRTRLSSSHWSCTLPLSYHIPQDPPIFQSSVVHSTTELPHPTGPAYLPIIRRALYHWATTSHRTRLSSNHPPCALPLSYHIPQDPPIFQSSVVHSTTELPHHTGPAYLPIIRRALYHWATTSHRTRLSSNHPSCTLPLSYHIPQDPPIFQSSVVRSTTELPHHTGPAYLPVTRRALYHWATTSHRTRLSSNHLSCTLPLSYHIPQDPPIFQSPVVRSTTELPHPTGPAYLPIICHALYHWATTSHRTRLSSNHPSCTLPLSYHIPQDPPIFQSSVMHSTTELPHPTGPAYLPITRRALYHWATTSHRTRLSSNHLSCTLPLSYHIPQDPPIFQSSVVRSTTELPHPTGPAYLPITRRALYHWATTSHRTRLSSSHWSCALSLSYHIPQDPPIFQSSVVHSTTELPHPTGPAYLPITRHALYHWATTSHRTRHLPIICRALYHWATTSHRTRLSSNHPSCTLPLSYHIPQDPPSSNHPSCALPLSYHIPQDPPIFQSSVVHSTTELPHPTGPAYLPVTGRALYHWATTSHRTRLSSNHPSCTLPLSYHIPQDPPIFQSSVVHSTTELPHPTGPAYLPIIRRALYHWATTSHRTRLSSNHPSCTLPLSYHITQDPPIFQSSVVHSTTELPHHTGPAYLPIIRRALYHWATTSHRTRLSSNHPSCTLPLSYHIPQDPPIFQSSVVHSTTELPHPTGPAYLPIIRRALYHWATTSHRTRLSSSHWSCTLPLSYHIPQDPPIFQSSVVHSTTELPHPTGPAYLPITRHALYHWATTSHRTRLSSNHPSCALPLSYHIPQDPPIFQSSVMCPTTELPHLTGPAYLPIIRHVPYHWATTSHRTRLSSNHPSCTLPLSYHIPQDPPIFQSSVVHSTTELPHPTGPAYLPIIRRALYHWVTTSHRTRLSSSHPSCALPLSYHIPQDPPIFQSSVVHSTTELPHPTGPTYLPVTRRALYHWATTSHRTRLSSNHLSCTLPLSYHIPQDPPIFQSSVVHSTTELPHPTGPAYLPIICHALYHWATTSHRTRLSSNHPSCALPLSYHIPQDPPIFQSSVMHSTTELPHPTGPAYLPIIRRALYHWATTSHRTRLSSNHPSCTLPLSYHIPQDPPIFQSLVVRSITELPHPTGPAYLPIIRRALYHWATTSHRTRLSSNHPSCTLPLSYHIPQDPPSSNHLSCALPLSYHIPQDPPIFQSSVVHSTTELPHPTGPAIFQSSVVRSTTELPHPTGPAYLPIIRRALYHWATTSHRTRLSSSHWSCTLPLSYHIPQDPPIFQSPVMHSTTELPHPTGPAYLPIIRRALYHWATTSHRTRLSSNHPSCTLPLSYHIPQDPPIFQSSVVHSTTELPHHTGPAYLPIIRRALYHWATTSHRTRLSSNHPSCTLPLSYHIPQDPPIFQSSVVHSTTELPHPTGPAYLPIIRRALYHWATTSYRTRLSSNHPSCTLPLSYHIPQDPPIFQSLVVYSTTELPHPTGPAYLPIIRRALYHWAITSHRTRLSSNHPSCTLPLSYHIPQDPPIFQSSVVRSTTELPHPTGPAYLPIIRHVPYHWATTSHRTRLSSNHPSCALPLSYHIPQDPPIFQSSVVHSTTELPHPTGPAYLPIIRRALYHWATTSHRTRLSSSHPSCTLPLSYHIPQDPPIFQSSVVRSTTELPHPTGPAYLPVIRRALYHWATTSHRTRLSSNHPSCTLPLSYHITQDPPIFQSSVVHSTTELPHPTGPAYLPIIRRALYHWATTSHRTRLSSNHPWCTLPLSYHIPQDPPIFQSSVVHSTTELPHPTGPAYLPIIRRALYHWATTSHRTRLSSNHPSCTLPLSYHIPQDPPIFQSSVVHSTTELPHPTGPAYLPIIRHALYHWVTTSHRTRLSSNHPSCALPLSYHITQDPPIFQSSVVHSTTELPHLTGPAYLPIIRRALYHWATTSHRTRHLPIICRALYHWATTSHRTRHLPIICRALYHWATTSHRTRLSSNHLLCTLPLSYHIPQDPPIFQSSVVRSTTELPHPTGPAYLPIIRRALYHWATTSHRTRHLPIICRALYHWATTSHRTRLSSNHPSCALPLSYHIPQDPPIFQSSVVHFTTELPHPTGPAYLPIIRRALYHWATTSHRTRLSSNHPSCTLPLSYHIPQDPPIFQSSVVHFTTELPHPTGPAIFQSSVVRSTTELPHPTGPAYLPIIRRALYHWATTSHRTRLSSNHPSCTLPLSYHIPQDPPIFQSSVVHFTTELPHPTGPAYLPIIRRALYHWATTSHRTRLSSNHPSCALPLSYHIPQDPPIFQSSVVHFTTELPHPTGPAYLPIIRRALYHWATTSHRTRLSSNHPSCALPLSYHIPQDPPIFQSSVVHFTTELPHPTGPAYLPIIRRALYHWATTSHRTRLSSNHPSCTLPLSYHIPQDPPSSNHLSCALPLSYHIPQDPPIFQSSVVHSTTELPHHTGPAYLPIIRRALYHWATTSHRTRLSSNHPSCTLPLSYHIPQDPPIFQSSAVHSTTELPHPTGPAYLPVIRRALYHWATTSHRTHLSSSHPSCTLPLSYHIPQDPPIFQSLVVRSITELPHPTGPAYLPVTGRALYHWATTSHRTRLSSSHPSCALPLSYHIPQDPPIFQSSVVYSTTSHRTRLSSNHPSCTLPLSYHITQDPPIFQSSVVHSTTELPHPTGPTYLPVTRRALYHWATTSHRTHLSSNHPSCTLPLSYHIPQDPPIFQSSVMCSTTELPHPTGPAYLPIIRRALYHWATTSHRTRLSSNHPPCTLPLSYHIPQDPPIFQSSAVHSTTELPHPTGPAYLPIIRRALYHWATTSHRTRLSSNHPSCALPLSYHIPQDPPIFQSSAVHSTTELPHPTGPAYLPIIRHVLYHWATTSHRTRLSSNHPPCTLPLSYHIPQDPPIFQSSAVHSTTELPHPTGPAYLPIIRRALYHWATTSHRTRLSSNHPSCALPLSYHIPQDPPIFQSSAVHSTTELPHPTGPAYLPIIRHVLYHWATTSHRTRLSSNHPPCTLPLSYHIPQDPPIFQSSAVHSTTELPHPTGPAYLPIIRRALYHWATTSHRTRLSSNHPSCTLPLSYHIPQDPPIFQSSVMCSTTELPHPTGPAYLPIIRRALYHWATTSHRTRLSSNHLLCTLTLSYHIPQDPPIFQSSVVHSNTELPHHMWI